jgi:hypothetical protein
MTIATKLANVETGYAEVRRADTNRRIGTVTRDFMTDFWVARIGRDTVGSGHVTRSEAVAALARRVEADAIARATFIARNSR